MLLFFPQKSYRHPALRDSKPHVRFAPSTTIQRYLIAKLQILFVNQRSKEKKLQKSNDLFGFIRLWGIMGRKDKGNYSAKAEQLSFA